MGDSVMKEKKSGKRSNKHINVFKCPNCGANFHQVELAYVLI